MSEKQSKKARAQQSAQAAEPPKPRAALRRNLIFAAVVLALAAGLALFNLWRNASQPSLCAVLTYGLTGEQEQVIALDEDATYDIDTGTYTVHLQVQDGAIAFVDSPCPDHVCEQFGWLHNAGDWAACMPAGAMVTLEER